MAVTSPTTSPTTASIPTLTEEFTRAYQEFVALRGPTESGAVAIGTEKERATVEAALAALQSRQENPERLRQLIGEITVAPQMRQSSLDRLRPLQTNLLALKTRVERVLAAALAANPDQWADALESGLSASIQRRIKEGETNLETLKKMCRWIDFFVADITKRHGDATRQEGRCLPTIKARLALLDPSHQSPPEPSSLLYRLTGYLPFMGSPVQPPAPTPPPAAQVKGSAAASSTKGTTPLASVKGATVQDMIESQLKLCNERATTWIDQMIAVGTVKELCTTATGAILSGLDNESELVARNTRIEAQMTSIITTSEELKALSSTLASLYEQTKGSLEHLRAMVNGRIKDDTEIQTLFARYTRSLSSYLETVRCLCGHFSGRSSKAEAAWVEYCKAYDARMKEVRSSYCPPEKRPSFVRQTAATAS